MKAENNKFPYVTTTPGAAPAPPGSGDVRLFVDVADGKLKIEDDAAAVTEVGAAAFSGDAADVAIADGGSLYTATDVEAALAEVMTAVGAGGIPDTGSFTYIDGTGAAAPGDPGAGDARLYAKTDGRFYSRDSAGVEYGPFDAAGGGGGGLYVSDETFPGSSLPAGWAFTGSGSAVVSGSKAALTLSAAADRLMFGYVPGTKLSVVRMHVKSITGAAGMPALMAVDASGNGYAVGPYNDGNTYAWTVAAYVYSGTNHLLAASPALTDLWLELMLNDGIVVGAGFSTDGVAWTGGYVNTPAQRTITEVGFARLFGTAATADIWELTVTEP